MEKVQKLSLEKHNQYKVWLESGQSFFVSEDVLVSQRILKGTELSQDKIEEIKKESQTDHGYQMSLGYLSYQLRSQKEVEDYLKDREISKESIAKIIVRLKDLKLVDDIVYGESYVRTMMRTSDKGPIVVREQLRKRGLKPNVIEEVMVLYTFEEQQRICFEVAQKALKKYRQKSHHEKLQKVRQHLMTKGFASDITKLVMDSLEVEKDEETEQDLLVLQGDKLWRKNQRFEMSKRKQKVTQSLYQKGFDFGSIQEYISKKEMEDEE